MRYQQPRYADRIKDDVEANAWLALRSVFVVVLRWSVYGQAQEKSMGNVSQDSLLQKNF
jgi:hypothetical protein